MHIKTHQKTQSSDLQTNMLQNYFSQNDSLKQAYNFQLDTKQKTLLQSNSPTLQERVETFMKFSKPKQITTTQKQNYSIIPTLTKLNPLLNQYKSQNQIASKQNISNIYQNSTQKLVTESLENTQKFSQIIQSYITPKQSSGQLTTQFKSPLSASIKRPESTKPSNQKVQPHSHQGSLSKINKMIEEQPLKKVEYDLVLSRNVILHQPVQKNLKIVARKNSEETQQYKLSFENSLKSIKSQTQLQGNHLKTQSVQLVDNGYKSANLLTQESSILQKTRQTKTDNPPSQTLNLLINYRNNVTKFMFETYKKDIKSLIDFVTNEVELYDQTVRGMMIGIRTLDGIVPIDYLLSQPNLQLSIIFQYSTQLSIVPMINTIPKDLHKRVTLKDFQFIRCIGHGGFSQVYLVREKSTGIYFAMKLIQKSHILGQGKQSIIQCERDIMTTIENPFLVKMHYAFESRKYLVFVLEYCSGGELFYLLKKVKRMTEKQAFFYFSQICLGMKHLHDNQIVYRDIKPENILIDFQGHVRIADFGLSKPNMEPNDIAFSFCGSPEYMAPEMLLKSGHSFKLDIYCLGALLYELITGLPPFYSRNTEEIYQRILNQKLSFPSSVKISLQLKDLLSSLLVKNPKNRISDLKGIFQHPWCLLFLQGDSLSNIEQRKTSPPFIPDPYNFNFDEEEFGQGEPEFLQEMRIIQEQQSENSPSKVVLPKFYYQNSLPNQGQNNYNIQKRFQEGTGGTEGQQKTIAVDRFMSVQLNVGNQSQSDQKQPLSHRSSKQTPKLQINQRFSTLEDALKSKPQMSQTPKPMLQYRQQTNHEFKRGKY